MIKKQFVNVDIDSRGMIAGFEYISSSLYEEKKSKFYAYIFDIDSIDNANEILLAMKKHFKDARHVVYTYILENEYYYSDDGEPSGTGGKAIFSLLEKQKIINTLVIVVRYFGGILLGVGPLSRAYSKSVKMAQQNLQIVSYIPKTMLELKCEYSEESILRNLVQKVEANIMSTKYDEKVHYTISVKEDEKELFNEYK